VVPATVFALPRPRSFTGIGAIKPTAAAQRASATCRWLAQYCSGSRISDVMV